MKTNKFFSLLILFGCALLAGCNPDDPKAPNSNPNQVIHYTTSDGAPIALANVWKETGGGIIYHSYENGIGIIVFESPITEIVNRGFSNCRNLISITIPDSVTSIGESAFYDCSGLTSVAIPDSVTSIEGYAFCDCTGLTSITIPDSVTSIGEGAFNNCSSLTSINIPNSVTSIGEGAFCECTSVTSTIIGNGVISIGSGAFAGCSGLTSVFCEPTVPPTLGYNNVFHDESGSKISGLKIYVPIESIDAYKTATYWSEYAYAIVGYNF